MIIYHRTPFRFRDKVKHIDVIATDLVDNENWVDYIRRNTYNEIFFDNAVFEQQPLPVKRYMEYIVVLQPNRWVLPDIFNDVDQTLSISMELIHTLPTDVISQAMIVVCKLPKTYTLLTQIIESGVSTIGVPYIPNVDRLYVVKSLIERYCTNIDIHLLGIQYPSEPLLYTKYRPVRSADTGLALTTTKKKLRLSKGEYYKEVIKSLEDYDSIDGDLFLENVEYLNTITQ